jgi:Metal-dependent hydrolase
MFATFVAAQGSTPAWAEKGCVAFVNGTGDYDQNCYNSGLERMAPGKCYTFNTARGQVPTWINNQATETWWWVETECVLPPPELPLEEGKYIIKDKGCINFVNGTGDYDKHCYKSGLENMAPGKCYTFNKRRGNVPQWINNQASEVWWWDQIECADTISTINVATWNIRLITTDDEEMGHIWENRLNVMVNMIKSYDFDILGIQEDGTDELEDLVPLLDNYDSVGFYNHASPNPENPKTGTFNTIFFRNDRFEHLESGMFYVAENERDTVKSWGAAYIRSCTWVKLKHKYSGEILWVFNTHTDYEDTAEKPTAGMLLRKIEEIAKGSRALLMGDLNFGPWSSYDVLNDSDLLDDSYDVAEIKLEEKNVITYNATYAHENIERKDHLDYIFVTDPNSVLQYDVLQDQYEYDGEMRYPSDHFPVVIKIKL